jgi:Ca-activated chloride channel family protein
MPEPMAQAMGWPAVQPTWRDLLLLAQDKQGWGRFGHSEWGMFRLGKTDPRLSTSGLHSMIATYYAATQKSADLTLGDVNAGSSSSFVQGIEASVTHYAPTIDSFLDNLAGLDSLDYISAVPAEEQEVLQYNEGLHSPESPREPPRIPLAAIYPGGSTLVADHPYIVLNWVTDSAKKRIAAGFLSWLQEPPQQERFAAAGFRDDRHNATGLLTHEVGILAAQPASVLDPPRDPAVVAAIEATWTQTRKRAQVLVVLALANSAQRTSVERGLGQLTRNDEVAVWGVAAGAPVQRGSMEPLPAADDAVLHAINSAPVGTRRVALYQAVDDAYRYLAEHADPERINAVIVISAVRDDGSGTTLTQVERTLRAPSSAPPVRVYTVALDGSDATALLGIQKASGGVAASGDAASAIRTALANF